MSEESQEFDRDFMKTVRERKERHTDSYVEDTCPQCKSIGYNSQCQYCNENRYLPEWDYLCDDNLCDDNSEENYQEFLTKPIRANFRERVPRTDGGFNVHYLICIPEELNTPEVVVTLPIKVKKMSEVSPHSPHR